MLTFCSTVQHIINAIRKLAAVVTPEEAVEPLYRGVRGELPHGFWVPAKEGSNRRPGLMVPTAVDGCLMVPTDTAVGGPLSAAVD